LRSSKVATAKLNGIDPHAYLAHVLKHLPSAKSADLGTLLTILVPEQDIGSRPLRPVARVGQRLASRRLDQVPSGAERPYPVIQQHPLT